MQIFELQPDSEKYRWLSLVQEADFNIVSDLVGSRCGDVWVPLRATWIDDELNAGKAKSDFPTFGSTPVFSKRAADALIDILVENGELLPLRLEEEQYFVYNTTRTIDALDEDRSELVRFSTGRVMRVVKYVFREDVSWSPIFRIPQLRAKVFVTESFVKRVFEADLTGFEFRPV